MNITKAKAINLLHPRTTEAHKLRPAVSINNGALKIATTTAYTTDASLIELPGVRSTKAGNRFHVDIVGVHLIVRHLYDRDGGITLDNTPVE